MFMLPLILLAIWIYPLELQRGLQVDADVSRIVQRLVSM